jgi:hypothetical protein
MQELFGLKHKAITIYILIMMGVALLFTPFSIVQGQGALGFGIIQVVKENGFSAITSGNVSEAITVQAVLYTSNGQYKVYFGDKLVDSNVASGYYVASNFTIPEVTAGNYTITLTDVAIASNDTSSFVVNTAYVVQPIVPLAPAQLQEGSNLSLNVSITGGQPNTTNSVNITLIPPAGLNTTYTKMVSLTTSSLGTANIQMPFPDSSFAPSGSTTIYTGTYTAYFNQTQSLGQSSFFVGFTDKSQYHRQNIINVHAAGYQPSQSATLQITNPTGNVVSSQTVTSSSQGIISSTWNVPSNAPVGNYNITITPQGTAKTIADYQTFQIPGYPTSFRALNLANESISELLIEVFDQSANQRYNGTTLLDGITIMNLEAGSYTVTAYWNQVKVGEIPVTVAANGIYDIPCTLTNLQVKLQNKNGIVIPSTDLNLVIQYTDRTGLIQNRNVSGQTDISGIYNFNSTLPGISYTITASKYGVIFNQGNGTINNLPPQGNYQAIIICPEKTLTITTVDSNSALLSNARIELIEKESGIFFSVTTDSNGQAQLQVTFGQYRAKVYSSGNTLLNETTINVLSNTQTIIQCVLYNLKVTVKVVDYFGNPISNINVQISRSDMTSHSNVTQNDGTATFDNVVGGDIVVTAYLSGDENSYVATNIHASSSTIVELSMANYVVVAGMVMATTVLATIIIFLVAAMLLVCIVIYKKMGFKLRPKNKG